MSNNLTLLGRRGMATRGEAGHGWAGMAWKSPTRDDARIGLNKTDQSRSEST